MESLRKKVECSIKYVRKKRGSLSVAPNTLESIRKDLAA